MFVKDIKKIHLNWLFLSEKVERAAAHHLWEAATGILCPRGRKTRFQAKFDDYLAGDIGQLILLHGCILVYLLCPNQMGLE